MRYVFASGCGLLLYKPAAASAMLAYLQKDNPDIGVHLVCCHHEPGLPKGSRVINVCPGCDRRYRTLYEGVDTISLWEVLAEKEDFPFPDYGGIEVTVHDACPVRSQGRVHRAVRALLAKMNIRVKEVDRNQSASVCCGDSFYPALPIEEVHARMKTRADSMPCDEVVVYCTSCIKSMGIGGKRPRHLLDLLLAESTEMGDTDIVRWHKELDAFIESH